MRKKGSFRFRNINFMVIPCFVLLSRSSPGGVTFEPSVDTLGAVGGLIFTSPVFLWRHRWDEPIATFANGAVTFNEAAFEMLPESSTAFAKSDVVGSLGPNPIAVTLDGTVDISRLERLNAATTK